MRAPPWPKVRHLNAYVLMAGLAVLLIGVAVSMARPSRPQPVAATSWNPQWRCAGQAKGDPICVRDLPPAARPDPARSPYEPGR
jgi:hypothetical protein